MASDPGRDVAAPTTAGARDRRTLTPGMATSPTPAISWVTLRPSSRTTGSTIRSPNATTSCAPTGDSGPLGPSPSVPW